jgi:hypothetical protein
MVETLSGWNQEPFLRGIQYIEQINHLLHLSMRNIAQTTKAPALVEAILNLEASDKGTELSEAQRARLVEAESDAKFAQLEMEQGFPLLHAHALVAMWGAVEVTINDYLVALLLHDPTALAQEAISKTRISVAEFELLDREDRMRLLLEDLGRTLKTEYKRGVNRFELLLGAFGLSGPVDEDIKTRLFEMFHIRNVLVHRASIADGRFVKACPWMGLNVGERVVVDHDRYLRLSGAVYKYLTIVVNRVRDRGIPRSTDKAEQPSAQ